MVYIGNNWNIGNNWKMTPKIHFNFVCFILGNSPASEFYMPTFRNILFHLYKRVGMKNGCGRECWGILHIYLPMKMEQSVPKRRNIKFRRRGITQKKAYNIYNTEKV
jgi:hypothetical protein